LEPVDEFVVGRRLAVDIEGGSEVVEITNVSTVTVRTHRDTLDELAV
jgi:hypothetical protein